MYVVMGVHHPKLGMEKPLLEVQENFGVAQRGHSGLISAFIWKDDQTDVVRQRDDAAVSPRSMAPANRPSSSRFHGTWAVTHLAAVRSAVCRGAWRKATGQARCGTGV
jgi:hypothetical protein